MKDETKQFIDERLQYFLPPTRKGHQTCRLNLSTKTPSHLLEHRRVHRRIYDPGSLKCEVRFEDELQEAITYILERRPELLVKEPKTKTSKIYTYSVGPMVEVTPAMLLGFKRRGERARAKGPRDPNAPKRQTTPCEMIEGCRATEWHAMKATREEFPEPEWVILFRFFGGESIDAKCRNTITGEWFMIEFKTDGDGYSPRQLEDMAFYEAVGVRCLTRPVYRKKVAA